MPGLSNVVCVTPPSKLHEAIRYSLEREGAQVHSAASETELRSHLKRLKPTVVITNDEPLGQTTCSRMTQNVLASSKNAPPLFRIGRPNGAAPVGINTPGYLRDFVALVKLTSDRFASRSRSKEVEPSANRDPYHIYHLVRGLLAAQCTALLVMWRGIRRGEIAFRKGDVASAHVGMLHGSSALRQLMLWTDARYELRYEHVPLKAQFPLSRSEVVEDSRCFLSELHQQLGDLRTSTVLKAGDLSSKSVPSDVRAIADLCNGQRTIADIAADSAMGDLDTIGVLAKLVAREFVNVAEAPHSNHEARAALLIDGWSDDGNDDLPATDRIAGPPPGHPASPPKPIPQPAPVAEPQEIEPPPAQPSPAEQTTSTEDLETQAWATLPDFDEDDGPTETSPAPAAASAPIQGAAAESATPLPAVLPATAAGMTTQISTPAILQSDAEPKLESPSPRPTAEQTLSQPTRPSRRTSDIDAEFNEGQGVAAISATDVAPVSDNNISCVSRSEGQPEPAMAADVQVAQKTPTPEKVNPTHGHGAKKASKDSAAAANSSDRGHSEIPFSDDEEDFFARGADHSKLAPV